jgi:hypothetical protein
MTTLAAIDAALQPHSLAVMGGFVASDAPDLPEGTQTLLLIGPSEPGFWAHLNATPEWQDKAPNPIDRWSRRVIGTIACTLGGKALFPFGGPPWQPFHAWALQSGRAWSSPVHLLVHDKMGLFASYRGALALKTAVDLPPPAAKPCDTCLEKPCLTACPPTALTAAGYDVPRCRSFLDSPEGAACLTTGCAVRRACPRSQAYARLPEQSAYHMGQFHK